MKFRRLILAFLVALLLPSLAQSSPFLVGTFPDNYLHPLDGNIGERNVDVIGISDFNLIEYRLWGDRSVPGWIQIDIRTAGVTGEATRVTDAALGDLFFDTQLDGNFDLAVALRTHQQSPYFTSMGIEDNIIQKGDIFLPASYRLSDAYYDPSFWYFGDNEIVTGLGGVLGKADVAYDGAGIITVAFQKDGLDPENLRLHLGWTCGNEVMDNTTQVPEPSTLLLLGSGIFGMAVMRRKTS
jgi:hypothetical protein